jgi:hypothetical protein
MLAEPPEGLGIDAGEELRILIQDDALGGVTTSHQGFGD